MKNIVSQDQAGRAACEKFLGNQECLGQTVGTGLSGKLEPDAPIAAIT